MALVYFLDGNDAPQSTGNAYARVQNIDDKLTFASSCISWVNKTAVEKEELIKSITRRIDKMYTFYGEIVDDTTPQPLAFPRDKIGFEDFFGVQHQKAMLINYIGAVIEYELSKIPIGAHSLSMGATAVVPRQQITPREALVVISQYVRL